MIYIFGYLSAEILIMLPEVFRSSVLLLSFLMLSNPFIFLILCPSIPEFYPENYYKDGLQVSLILCALNVIWGLILLRLLIWLVNYDLLKLKTTKDKRY